MAAIASAELIADLERAVQASPAPSILLLRGLAGVLAATTDRPIEGAG
jgi:hypothetical protein